MRHVVYVDVHATDLQHVIHQGVTSTRRIEEVGNKGGLGRVDMTPETT
jgi:hypothetical protein